MIDQNSQRTFMWTNRQDERTYWLLANIIALVLVVALSIHSAPAAAFHSATETCYLLTLDAVGEGADPTAAPEKSPACTDESHYVGGAKISLTSAPAEGWNVAGWIGTDNDTSTNMTNTLTMPPTNHNATVIYERVCYHLVTTHEGQGEDPAANLPNSDGCLVNEYVEGEVINLTAVPAEGWHVAGWGGTDDNASTNTTNTLTMPGTNHRVSVKYEVSPSCYRLVTTHQGQGEDPTATPPNSDGCLVNEYIEGEVIDLTAVPAEGWHVAGWEGTDDDASTNTTNTLKMLDTTHTVQVLYEVDCYTLNVKPDPPSTGTVKPDPPPDCEEGKKYTAGTAVTLTAEAEVGYGFDKWSGAVTGNKNPETVIMDGNKDVTAVFSELSTPTQIYLPLTLNVPARRWISIPHSATLANLYTVTACPDPSLRFAGTRDALYKWNTDETWSPVDGAPANVRDFLFAGDNCTSLYAASFNDGVYRLGSGGKWNRVGETRPTARSLVWRKSVLFVGTQRGLFRFRNQDWELVLDGDITRLSLAGDRIYAAVFGKGVFYNDTCTADSCSKWESVGDAPAPFNNAFDVVGEAVTGTPPSWAVMATASGVYRWDGAAWSAPAVPPEPAGNVFALAQLGNQLLAGLRNGGVWLSDDQGERWSPLGLQEYIIVDLVVVPGDGIYAVTPDQGIWYWPLH